MDQKHLYLYRKLSNLLYFFAGEVTKNIRSSYKIDFVVVN